MINLWSRLGSIFDIAEEIYPEIEITGLSDDGMRSISYYLVRHLRGLSTEFHTFTSDEPILVKSEQTLVQHVTSGDWIGAVAGELIVARYALPEMIYIFEEPGMIIISYATGPHWSPLSLIALFEWFRIVSITDRRADINLSQHFFSPGWIQAFNRLLQDYLHETVKSD